MPNFPAKTLIIVSLTGTPIKWKNEPWAIPRECAARVVREREYA